MNRLHETLRKLASDLKRKNYAWALLGGLAVSAHAEPRFTRDIDIGVRVATDQEAEQLIHFLQLTGYRIQKIIEQGATGRLAAVRLLPPGEPKEGIIVDLLFASSGIEAEIVRDAKCLEIIPGLAIAVARPGHLAALKVLARDDVRRPQDLMDLINLLQVMNKAEMKRAEAALGLITKRGYQRGRDLGAAWKDLLAKQKG